MLRAAVFCGSHSGTDPIFRETATGLGTLLGSRSLGLVYGGGQVGLMGAVADAVLHAGGEVIGVIPECLAREEIAHQGITELRVVDSMHTRKAQMAKLADLFITLPGGLGTLDELCEILTWAQLRIHRKPCGLLNLEGYFDPLLAVFDRAVEKGFLRPEQRALLHVASQPEELLDRLLAARV